MSSGDEGQAHETSEFGASQTPRRPPPIIDLSSVEKTVSTVTGDFRDRLSTYALDSPERIRSLDATLTPAPEVSLQQSSPTRRKAPSPNLEDEVSEDEDEEELQQQQQQPPQQTSRRSKRTIRTVITPSQFEAILGPSKRGRTSDPVTLVQGSVQTSIREHFLRKADRSEVRGQGDNDTFDLLSQEQVTSLLATVGSSEIKEDDTVDQDEDEDIREDDEMRVEDVEEDKQTRQEDETMGDVHEDIQEPELDSLPVPSRPPIETPSKSERNLFKSRQRNAVHNVHTNSNASMNIIRSQYRSLQNARTHSTQRGTIAGKEYAVPNEKAEERLSLTVSKEDFARMRVVGQFNLGFIIAVRERHVDTDNDVEDVFIIDQHASDEKYNFERLQAETIMQVQTLARYAPKLRILKLDRNNLN
jgi:DNA mismatch repair ATPase MutL